MRALRVRCFLLVAACAVLAGCGTDRTASTPATTGSIEPLSGAPTGRISAAPLAAPGAPPALGMGHVRDPGEPVAAGAAGADMAGRWTLSSSNGKRCAMTFAVPANGPGAIAPEGGCPGRFYTSRSFVMDANGGVVIRDYTGAPLAQLAQSGPGRFEGHGPDGQQVVLER